MERDFNRQVQNVLDKISMLSMRSPAAPARKPRATAVASGPTVAGGTVALIRQGSVGSGEARDTGLDVEAGRDTGLGAEAETGRGEGSEFFERMDRSISCSFVISRVICSWSAVSWSTLRVICS
jgi:hypothetical protein